MYQFNPKIHLIYFKSKYLAVLTDLEVFYETRVLVLYIIKRDLRGSVSSQ